MQPGRLRVARERRGLTKTELAAAINVTPRMVTHYESGSKAPSPATLARIADALGFEAHFFESEQDLRVLNPSGVSFRALSSLSASMRARVLGAASIAPDIAQLVDDYLVVPDPEVPDLSDDDPETAATVLRREWGLDDKMIPNMVHLVEAHGVRVFSLAEDTNDVDAFATFIDGRPFMFLNRRKSPERGRLDVAHELAHLVLHRGMAEPRGRTVEAEANRFAGALLAPARVLQQWARGRPLDAAHFTAVKQTFGMSLMATVRRHYDLDLITEWQYRDFIIEHRNARTTEPAPCMGSEEQERSYVFEQLAVLLRRDGTSTTELAWRLGVKPDELHAMTFGIFPLAFHNPETVQARLSSRPSLQLVPDEAIGAATMGPRAR